MQDNGRPESVPHPCVPEHQPRSKFVQRVNQQVRQVNPLEVLPMQVGQVQQGEYRRREVKPPPEVYLQRVPPAAQPYSQADDPTQGQTPEEALRFDGPYTRQGRDQQIGHHRTPEGQRPARTAKRVTEQELLQHRGKKDEQPKESLGRYVTDGMGEVIKYGCIKDRKLFDLLEKYGCYENLKEHLTDVIATCVDIKRRVVEEDEFDTGERILLNFGHTLAHTIEQHFHYERESHGEAVAIGMYQITKIAEEKGLTKKGEAEHIRKVLEAYKLPVKADVPLPQLTEAIKLDKKTLNNKLKVVLLHEIGDSYIYPTGQEFFDGDRKV